MISEHKDVEKIISELKDKTIGFERRRQIVYDLLSALFLKALQSDLINKNPMIAIEKPKHIKKNGEVFTDEDEILLEKVLKDENLDVF